MTTLFDQHGRCIPGNLSSAVNNESRRYFKFDNPEIDFNSIYSRHSRHLGLTQSEVSLVSFKERIDSIIQDLEKDTATRGILNGIGVPFIVPKQPDSDFGANLDKVFLPAVGQSYEEKYPDYSFVIQYHKLLSQNVSCVDSSRHSIFLDAVKKSAVVGMFFPCLREYSIPAALEQIQIIPEKFLLAGGLDTCAAFVSCPDLLLNKVGYPPLIWMAGIKGSEVNEGFHFEAYGYNLTFNRRIHLGNAAEYWGCSLVVLG